MEVINCTLTIDIRKKPGTRGRPSRLQIPELGIDLVARNAFYDTCRILADRGYGDCALQAHDETGKPTIRAGSIRDAARWKVKETDKIGPTLARWMPFPHATGSPPARSEGNELLADGESP